MYDATQELHYLDMVIQEIPTDVPSSTTVGMDPLFIHHKRRHLYAILLETRKAFCMQGVRIYWYEFQCGNTHTQDECQ